MTLSALLGTLIGALERHGIPFMVTGSVAAAAHGAGRATLDVDLVIEATAAQLSGLVASLHSPTLYVSDEAAREALAHAGMFNVIDTQSGWKADLIMRKPRPFSQTEFARRQALDLDGLSVWVATVEDTMIAKLEWARLGGSARQIEDVAALLAVTGPDLDREYLERWIGALDLEREWVAAQAASAR
jgi:hypothetical protein